MRDIPRSIAFGAVLASLSLGAGIAATDLWPPDEPRVAAISREMLAEGSWLVPRLNGRPFLEEPPLFNWLQAAAYRVAGAPSAAAARLPAVLGAIGGVLATGLVARALGASPGIAAIVLATAPEYWWMARQATPDTANAAMTTLALGLFFLAWRSGRGWLLAGAVAAAGTAFWLKSFLGVGLAVFVAGAFLLAAGRGRLGWRGLLLAGAALGVVAAAWLVVLSRSEGTGAVSIFVLTNHLERITRTHAGGHTRSTLYYLPNLALGLLPWSAVMPAALVAAWRERRDPARLLPLLWCAIMVLALTVASTKRPHYALAAYPGFALLVAQWWPQAMARGPGRLTAGVLTALLLLACPVLVLTLLHLEPAALLAAASAADRTPSTWIAALTPLSMRWSTWMPVVLIVAAGLLFVRGRRAHSPSVTLLAASTCVTIVHLVIVLAVLPRFDPMSSARPLAEQLDGAIARGVRVAVFGFENHEKLSPLLFYTGRRLVELDDADALVAFLDTGPACALVEPRAYEVLDIRGTPARAGRLRIVLVSGRSGGCPEATAIRASGSTPPPPR